MNVFSFTVVAFPCYIFLISFGLAENPSRHFWGKSFTIKGCAEKSCSNLDFFFFYAESRTNQLSLDSHLQKSHLEEKTIPLDVVEVEGF